MNVRGFPTLFFSDAEDNRLKVYGAKPYAQFEQTLLSLYPEAGKAAIDTSPDAMFTHYSTLTTKEYAVLSGINMAEAEFLLTGLAWQGQVGRMDYEKGVLWGRKAW
jgi:hypothetical protein